MDTTIIRDPKDPNHHSWKATFGLYTWWKTCDGNDRVFIIVQRHYDDAGNITAIEILDRNTEWPKEVPYPDIFKAFKAGLLQRTSRMPDL